MSKAFAKSKYIMSVSVFLCSVCATSSISPIKFVAHDLLGRNPCYRGSIKCNTLAYNSSCTILSIIFEAMHKSEIGL